MVVNCQTHQVLCYAVSHAYTQVKKLCKQVKGQKSIWKLVEDGKLEGSYRKKLIIPILTAIVSNIIKAGTVRIGKCFRNNFCSSYRLCWVPFHLQLFPYFLIFNLFAYFFDLESLFNCLNHPAIFWSFLMSTQWAACWLSHIIIRYCMSDFMESK